MKHEDKGNHLVQPVFHIFPDAEYDTGDLFKKHPDPGKEHLWQYYWRSDDLQVFASGEKLHPVAIEQLILKERPRLQEALLVGTGRPKAVLLLEPKKAADERLDNSGKSLLDEVLPSIELANKTLPLYAKLGKESIILTTSGKPLPRTAKGSVQMKQAVADYEQEIKLTLNM